DDFRFRYSDVGLRSIAPKCLSTIQVDEEGRCLGSLFEPLRCQILVIPRRAAVGWPKMFQLHINFHTQDIIGTKIRD
ncbi:hypothetical protein AVEN_262067-1, partial [Araneus ventricosus]